MCLIDAVPIGWVRSSRSGAADDDWDTIDTTIELDSQRFDADAVLGLDEFSHVEVIYLFDRVDTAEVEIGARHPRGNPAWPKVGIFAQRAKGRPNRLGLTVCRLIGIDGLRILVQGLDAIDGTPVLDLKPYLIASGPRGRVDQPEWAHQLMATYWKR